MSDWTGEYQYTVDQVLSDMIERCDVLDLRIDRPEVDVERQTPIMLTMHVMSFLNAGLHRIAL